jgi:hypothetical protein
MTTQFPEDPSLSITKNSREALHDTSNATDSIKDWRTFWKDVLDELPEASKQQLTRTKQKTIDEFLDTICCALEEISGEEVFDCFVEAVQAQHEYTKKEYDKTNELISKVTNG